MVDEVKSKLWERVHYACSTTNCNNCDHANKDKWNNKDSTGECSFLKGFPFMILRYGICKFHSTFKTV